jgi:hypothetical protein
MSDWEFLHEMRDRGYSADDIALAAGVGYAPWEEVFISREWVDQELKNQSPDPANSLRPKETFKSRNGFPFSVLEQAEILEDLVGCAERHFRNTGRYLQVWGELGEIYAEVKFGLCRHGTHRAGSDGTIDGKLVEVKTISPEKGQRPSDRQESRRLREATGRAHRREVRVHRQAVRSGSVEWRWREVSPSPAPRKQRSALTGTRAKISRLAEDAAGRKTGVNSR